MKREIFDQWRTIPLHAHPGVDALSAVAQFNKSQRVIVTGAGGASLVAEQIAFLLQDIGSYPALAVSSCEITRLRFFSDDAVLLAISQSGETADTLEAIKVAKTWGMPVVSLVNMPHSSMQRESDITVPLGAGSERCVLSTKSASAQIAFGYWLGHALNQSEAVAQSRLRQLGQQLSLALEPTLRAQFAAVVTLLRDQSSVYLLGRDRNFAAATLGALNLKEASYIHAEAFSAGELKHGVLALIEEGVPVILFGVGSDPYMAGALAEVKSRGAVTITVGSDLGDYSLPDPSAGMVVGNIICCQLLAYWLALEKGINPDRPRNLAKSVTVL